METWKSVFILLVLLYVIYGFEGKKLTNGKKLSLNGKQLALNGKKLALSGKKLALNGKKWDLSGIVLSSEEGKDEKISSEENKPLRRTRRSFNYRTRCSVKLQIFCSVFKYGNLVKKFCIHVPVKFCNNIEKKFAQKDN